MAAVRRHLRACVTLWLLCQTAALSALVPGDCCASHQPVAGEPACHQSAQARHCPMRAADGTPCPMHRGSGYRAGTPDSECVLRGSCNAPAAALHALLWSPGVLVQPLSASPAATTVPVHLPARERRPSLLLPPDSPPPRG